MGKRAARAVWEYDSREEFDADGGVAAYGDGAVRIRGIDYLCIGGTLQYASRQNGNKRPVLTAVGHSLIAQDTPAADGFYSATAGNVTLGGSTNTVVNALSHNYYFNALSLCAFDYLHCDIPAANINPALTTRLINGIYGASGQQLISAIDASCDVLFELFVSLAGGSEVFCVFDPWINDINNNDVAGYHQKIWRFWRRIQSKAIDIGIVPIALSPTPSTFANSQNKSKNWYQIRDLVLTEGQINPDIIAVNVSDIYRDTAQINGYPFPIAYASDAEAVALTGHASAKMYSLFCRQGDAATNQGLHPNARAQAMRAIATYDAVAASNRVVFAPPTNVSHLSINNLSENSTFEATTGTAVTGGTNVAVGASTTSKGWQRHAFSANTEINVSDYADPDGSIDPLVSVYPTSGGAATDNCGLASTALASSRLVPGASRLRFFEDVTIVKAKNLESLERKIRITGGNFAGIGGGTGGASAPGDVPPDNQKGYRNAPGLMEGRRLVISSNPFYCDPTPSNVVRNIGGGKVYQAAPFTSISDAANSGSVQIVHYAGIQIIG